MHWTRQIRRWRRIGLSSLLCLAVHGIAIAQTETTTPPQKTAHSSATPAKKRPTSGSAASKSASARTSTQKSAHTASPSPTSTSSHKSTHASAGTSARTSDRTSARTSAQKSRSSRGKSGSRKVAKKRGQQAIDSARAREIQEALIREHYMDGEPTGAWDSATQAAMQRYQADHGWQSKTTPDARALIKLGLGPSHDHLLNPESAMTMPTATTMTTPPAAADPKPADSQAPAENYPPKQ